MSKAFDMFEEYMQNTDEIIADFEKEAADNQTKLEEYERKDQLQKEAAIETAGALVGKGWMSPENLSQKIDQLRADPLGVIMQMTKTAAHTATVPSMGGGKKSSKGTLSTENMSNADKALLTKLRLI